ncbi:MAG: AbrB/MazE/SpoVT family DNA-binding domain-containing protein [Thermoplasmata archaeon]|nr:AbrB/MazE/SpoVT family DNA-binding domain-containing protein [Thermoplasmata archaeon]
MQLDLDNVLHIEETNVTVSGYRHRTTIPSSIFEHLGLQSGDTLRWILTKDGSVSVMKAESH